MTSSNTFLLAWKQNKPGEPLVLVIFLKVLHSQYLCSGACILVPLSVEHASSLLGIGSCVWRSCSCMIAGRKQFTFFDERVSTLHSNFAIF